MVYLTVRNIPSKLTLPQTVHRLARAIKGNFEAINFGPAKAGVKACYIKLSDRLDPIEVVAAINGSSRFIASITYQLPTFKLPNAKKKGQISLRTRMALCIPAEQSPDKVFVLTHHEIMIELQMKYTGLFNLSKKTGHKLLEGIARTIFERLKQVSDSNPDSLETGFKLSGAYRRMHPHFGDFQLILSTLHRLQDAAGAPRAQIVESDLISVPVQPFVIDNVPLDKVQAACAKYSDRISKKIADHVNNLKVEIGSGDTEEEIARKKVRVELKKLSPYLPLIIKEVILKHFIPRKSPFHKIRIYGEPFMPSKDMLAPLTKRHHAVGFMRSDRMYNMLRFNIPLQQYTSLMAMDGTVIGGAKLVVRSSDVPTLPISKALIAEMRASFGVAHDADDLDLMRDDEIQLDEEDEGGDEEMEM